VEQDLEVERPGGFDLKMPSGVFGGRHNHHVPWRCEMTVWERDFPFEAIRK